MVIDGYYIICYARTYERVSIAIMKIHYFKHLLYIDLDV